jgi:hypothetical protein
MIKMYADVNVVQVGPRMKTILTWLSSAVSHDDARLVLQYIFREGNRLYTTDGMTVHRVVFESSKQCTEECSYRPLPLPEGLSRIVSMQKRFIIFEAAGDGLVKSFPASSLMDGFINRLGGATLPFGEVPQALHAAFNGRLLQRALSLRGDREYSEFVIGGKPSFALRVAEFEEVDAGYPDTYSLGYGSALATAALMSLHAETPDGCKNVWPGCYAEPFHNQKKESE